MRFSSTSIKGAGLGRAIGFPTINLATPKTLPLRYGVYWCRVTIRKQQFHGALYYGPKTIGGKMGITLEIYLLLHETVSVVPAIRKSQKIDVIIDEFVRKPRKVNTISALKKLIQNDVALLTEKYRKKGGKGVDMR